MKHESPFNRKIERVIQLDISYIPELDEYALAELMGEIVDLIQQKYRNRFVFLGCIHNRDPKELIVGGEQS